ncbi:ATP-binding protein [Polaribacter sp. HaHaR_3_91]|uniref:nSTAND3 domain-containing NTPase n=1 Tax=Polaribacter sp. HaHaR_3_91 TaxID=2745561 RepID=UPI001C4FF5B6|nr:ATP-binding protein [Polaribacter sp. HaHaR_3_91]QXP62317.1 ATP-binding protein [Polaribacter sp. HaHaR_3_91]
MSRLQTIENQLKVINGTVFQELCDSYLTIRHKNYSAISRTGSQIGKQKTTKGTPDTFFQLSNGNFLYSEITTDTSTKNKLANDIKACFDPVKTKIPIEKIEEIVLCINWNIDQEKITELNTLAKSFKTDIRIRYLMLQELALEIHLHHRDLAHIYLELPLDTGQIVSIENFIKEYDRASKGIATPLNNIFLHRELELEKLSNAIDNEDFIILTGAPGVGKTKLAIETINNYLTKNESYQAYCVSYKSYTLLADLYQYFDVDKDYLLFVDDANRIDAFEQIIGFFKANRKGKLKIIITVRDYAFQEIGSKCQEFSTQRVDLQKLKDEQIIDIIKSEPFEILNSNYYDKIVRISEGNPRLAIMISLYAKEVNNLDALNDVSDLFEKYFSTFIKDNGEFENSLNIKCLGIISFFYTIPYKNKEVTESILDKFEISYNDFIDTIVKLDKLELAEIQFEHVKVPEQNLAIFFFYKAFIKDNLLSFQILLNNYFENYQNRFTDSIIPANNTFGPQNVMDKIKPELVNYWNLIKNDDIKALDFLKSFWFYLQDQTLEFIYEYIETLPKIEENKYDTSYENNQFTFDKDNIIELVSNFFRLNSNYLKDSIELLFEYVSRQPEKLPELIHKIRELLIFDRDDERYNFYRQNTLFDILINGVNNGNELLLTSFFELAKTFLSHSFQQFKGGRNNSFIHYQYPIPNNKNIQEFRMKIWDVLDSNFVSRSEMSFKLLCSYSVVYPDVNKEIMEFDLPFILNIIDKHLKVESFEHCKYVQSQIRWFKRHDFDLEEFTNLTNRFVNDIYFTFLKIDWDRFRDKEMYEFDDFQEYDRLKEAEIRSSFILTDINEINQFFNTFLLLRNLAKNNYNYNNSLDYIIDENCSRNFDNGLNLLNIVIEDGNEINYIPRTVFRNQLKTEILANRIWEIIQSKEFHAKELWELLFYDYIDDSLISKEYSISLINTIKKMNSSNTIYFNRIERFLSVEPNLFQIIIKIITEKNEKENTRLQVCMDFFSKHFKYLGNDIELIKKAYIQQNLIQNHFDYQGKGVLEILKIDKNFLIEFVESLYSATDKHSLGGDHSDMSYIWNINDIEERLIQVFDLIIEKDLYIGFLEDYCNVFFKNLRQEKQIKRADNFIRQYVIDNNTNYQKMRVIVDLIRHSRKELFEEIFLLFVSVNQDKEIFGRLMWNGSGGIYSGDAIIGDIQAVEWRNLLEIVKKSDLGIKLIPIKSYINEQVDSCLKSGDWERKRKFLREKS